jgi:hypothetical protein
MKTQGGKMENKKKSPAIYGLLIYCKSSFQIFNVINRDQDCNHIFGLLERFYYLRTPDESIRALLFPNHLNGFIMNSMAGAGFIKAPV